MTCYCFSRQFHVIWAVQNQSFSESCHARGEAWLRPGEHSPPSRVRVPAPTTPACAPTGGKGAREGQPAPQASRGRRGLCRAGLFRAPSAPRDCPGLARAVLGPAAGGRGAPGHRARAEDSGPPRARPPAPQARAPPILQGGAAPSSPVPRTVPYLVPGPGASGGGGRGRRPALLPRFRRSQELNIPPLRAAPMRKTSRQQHHLPPGAEPPAALPPGTPGAASGKARARGHTDRRCCMPSRDVMLCLGRGLQGRRSLWSQGCRCLSWDSTGSESNQQEQSTLQNSFETILEGASRTSPCFPVYVASSSRPYLISYGAGL